MTEMKGGRELNRSVIEREVDRIEREKDEDRERERGRMERESE